jgi:hypothetical protein
LYAFLKRLQALRLGDAMFAGHVGGVLPLHSPSAAMTCSSVYRACFHLSVRRRAGIQFHLNEKLSGKSVERLGDTAWDLRESKPIKGKRSLSSNIRLFAPH